MKTSTFARTLTAVTMAAALAWISGPAQAGVFRDWADDEITQVKNRVTTARDRANEIVNKARDGFNQVTSDMREMIDESVDDLKRELQDQIDGRNDFLGPNRDCGPGTDCDAFRWELVGLFDSIENAANTVFDVTPADARLDLRRTRQLIETVPGRALYPLYVAMTSSGAGAGLSDVLDRFSGDLRVLDDTLRAGSDFDAALRSTGARTSGLPGTCQAVLDQSQAFERAVTGVAVTAGAMKMLGKGLIAAGETGFDEKDAGVHGYVHVTFKNNRKKKVGNFLDGLADFGLAFSTYASNKLRYCTVLQARAETMAVLLDTDGSDDDMLSKIRQDLDEVRQNQAVILDRIDDIGPPWGRAIGQGPGRNAPR